MRLLTAMILLALATLGQAQDATPVPHPSEPGIQAQEEDAEQSPSLAADTQSNVLENPFLQSDLELIIGNVQRPNGLVWFEDTLYTVCNGDWTIYKIDDRSGETVTFVFGVRNGNSLIAESTEAGFDLWVPDPDAGMLWKVDQRRAAPVSIRSELQAPWGITRLNDASFLVTDTGANAIYSLSLAGEQKTIHSELRAPTGIARQAEFVYVANGGSARRGIEFFDFADDGSQSEIKPLVSGLQNTTNIVMGADGYLYFSYALGTRGVVGRVEPTQCHESGCSNQDVEMVVFSDIPAPLAIALSDDLRLFLHSRYRPEIYWVQLPT